MTKRKTPDTLITIFNTLDKYIIWNNTLFDKSSSKTLYFGKQLGVLKYQKVHMCDTKQTVNTTTQYIESLNLKDISHVQMKTANIGIKNKYLYIFDCYGEGDINFFWHDYRILYSRKDNDTILKRKTYVKQLYFKDDKVYKCDLPGPKIAYTWDPSCRIIKELSPDYLKTHKPILTIPTFHSYSFFSYFKPSIEETLSVIPDDLFKNENDKWLIYTSYQNYDFAANWHHLGITTIYKDE
jgi:hypothetical protein